MRMIQTTVLLIPMGLVGFPIARFIDVVEGLIHPTSASATSAATSSIPTIITTSTPASTAAAPLLLVLLLLTKSTPVVATTISWPRWRNFVFLGMLPLGILGRELTVPL